MRRAIIAGALGTLALLSPPPDAAAGPEQVHPSLSVTVYKGLLIDSVEPLAADIRKHNGGGEVKVLWHEQQRTDNDCPDLIVGHSQGGNAAIRQANACSVKDKPPKAIIVIDAGRAPQTFQVSPNRKFGCRSYYNPWHGIGGQYIYGCTNTKVLGYKHTAMPSAPDVVKGVRKILSVLLLGVGG